MERIYTSDLERRHLGTRITAMPDSAGDLYPIGMRIATISHLADRVALSLLRDTPDAQYVHVSLSPDLQIEVS